MIPQVAPVSTRTTSFNAQAIHSSGLRASTFECLRGMDLFSHMPDPDLLKLAAIARERRVNKGDILLRQDEAGGKILYVILEGEATVIWENAEGSESLLANLYSGDMAGEMELFSEGPHCATVCASKPSRLLLRGIREKPELALGFLAGISHRLRQSNRRMTGICNQKVPRRVASILVAMLDERGTRLKDAAGRRCVLLRDRPTQRRIAELAGTARETVSRVFAGWESSGWIEDRNGDFMVLDEVQLRHLAGEE